MQESSGAILFKSSLSCLHTELKSTAAAAFYVENFAWEAALGLKSLREAQWRDTFGPKKTKNLLQNF